MFCYRRNRFIILFVKMLTDFPEHHLILPAFTHKTKTAVSAAWFPPNSCTGIICYLSPSINGNKSNQRFFVKIHFDSFGAVLVVMLSNFCTKSSSVVLHRSEHYFQQQELFEDRQLFCIVNYFCEQFTIIETWSPNVIFFY